MNSQTRRQIQKYKPYYVPIGIILLVLFSLFIVVYPLAKQTLTLYELGKVVQIEVDALKKKLAILDSLDEQTLQEQLQLATSAIPIDKSLPSIFQTMEAISAESEVTVKSITLDSSQSLSTQAATMQSQTENKLGVNLLPFTVALEGEYDKLKALLIRTTQVRRFLNAKMFTISLLDGNITSTINLDAYYLPLQTEQSQQNLTPLVTSEENLLSKLTEYPNVGELVIPPDVVLPPVDPVNTRNPFAL